MPLFSFRRRKPVQLPRPVSTKPQLPPVKEIQHLEHWAEELHNAAKQKEEAKMRLRLTAKPGADSNKLDLLNREVEGRRRDIGRITGPLVKDMFAAMKDVPLSPSEKETVIKQTLEDIKLGVHIREAYPRNLNGFLALKKKQGK